MKNQTSKNRGEYKTRGWKKKAISILAGVVVFATTYALILPAITIDHDTAEEEPGIVLSQDYAAEEPVYEAPAYAEPVPEQPVYQEPVYEEPAYEEPAYEEPAYEPETPAEAEEPAAEVSAPAEAVGDTAPEETEQTAPDEEPAVVEEPAEEAVAEEEFPVVDASVEEVEHEETVDPEAEEEEYVPQGDPTADVEGAADWSAMFADVDLSGVWAEDLLTVARSQLGYTESTLNYVVNDAGDRKGYTRYGAWYGIPYGDWCAMFISFCLEYAGVPADEMPRAAGCGVWRDALRNMDRFAWAGEYDPVPGDIVFFTFHNSGSADHVGIVSEVWQNEYGDWKISVIEGNSSNRVQVVTYDYYASSILGFGILPDNYPAQSFYAETGDVNVSVEADHGAFPEDTSMVVEPVYDETVLSAVSGAVEGAVNRVAAVDITFLDADGSEIEPLIPIRVSLTSDIVAEAEAAENTTATVVHIGAEGETEVISPADVASAGDEVVFDADAFSVYAIVMTSIEKNILASDGNTYRITVTYDESAGIPADAELEAEELSGAAFDDYAGRAAAAMDVESFEYVRVFDISIADGAGNELQPAAPVQVSIQLLDAEHTTEEFSVVHFKDESEQPERMETETDGNVVSFSTTGFSAYAIVQGPSAIPMGWVKVTSIEELRELAGNGEGLYIGHIDGYYMTNGITQISGDRTGITKTKPAANFPGDAAVPYYFELVSDTLDQFKVYCLDGDEKKYVIQTLNSLNLTTEDQATVFTVEPFGNTQNTFRIKGNDGFYWNMQGGTGGASFAAYNNSTDGNAKLYFWRFQEGYGDPYGLNGKTYGLMSWGGGTTGRAMMASSSEEGSLEALALTVMARKNNNEDKLFVPNDSDISLWTFEWISADQYYLTTVNDSARYLKVDASGLSLVAEGDKASALQVVPGTGAHAGEICLKSGNTTLTYTGAVATGFGVKGAAGSEWLNLVELSELTSDYFMTHSASKVSVSDKSVTNGSRIIVYTRTWNDTTKKYEFYAIDHDGSLIPCYESGDSIQWIGGRINTLLWNLVEYYYEGTTDPNYYYELYNQYAENFIAPQVTDGQILSPDTIGINLNGRRNGQYYSTIVAWDDGNYAYAGLKADVKTGKVVSCPLSEADDFYFAVMQDIPVDDTLTTVPTIDHTQYGITMKIVDFGTKTGGWNEQDRFLGTNAGGKTLALEQGLLSTDLGADGYPTNKDDVSLSELYSKAQEVNHLFIGSTYSGSGYFEFDSAQNFASLNTKTGDFTVYKELGTMDGDNKDTLKHGQFMPYNDLEAGVFASVNAKNRYDATAGPLPESDPRKYEQMYLVRNPNYYFGVELQASFTQTANGHDDWGHDIIYEFTGDDDFWLYVDGELIIDLGGIHSAVSGSVNYSTGEVKVNGTQTTLRDLFESNYKTRNPGADDAEVKEYLAQYFNEDETVFKDYTTHTMRIFYMERGAGASNLHMRFNLASVRPGTVLLSKELSGIDSTESVLAEFPYQIYYRLPGDAQEYLLTQEREREEQIRVVYKDTITPVKYQGSLEVDGVPYEGVFLLEPGQVAEIDVPDDAIDYRIVECGVNTNVYSSVTVNGVKLEGVPVEDHGNRKDYDIGYASTTDRPRVTYVNEVNPDALRTLTFTKRLYKEDGKEEIHNNADSTTFGFRLYFDTEFDSDLTLTNMHIYHVKDPDGNYCRWDAATQKFVSIERTDYDELTDEEKASVSFNTSMNGSISKIPVDYTVEVRQVLAGTQFKVEERDYEIPDGYSLQKYVLYSDYKGSGDDTGVESNDPAGGTIVAGEDPHVDICNLKGWGLRVNKYWTDADYMAERDSTYFALFTDDGAGNLALVEGSVRQLAYGQNTIYWYYLRLPVADVPFDRYEIREVEVTDPTVDKDGVVTAWADEIVPIDDEGSLKLEGSQKGETVSSTFEYTVLYEKGKQEADSNVRVDTVTNNRPGIVLKKQDWSGKPLAGATFTLEDSSGNTIGTFTSDSDGQITIAFLQDDVDYTLTETKTPQGYHGLEAPMTICLHEGKVTVGGVENEYYVLEQGAGDTPVLTIKNCPYTFQVVKKDKDTDKPLAGVTFALHKQVTDGAATIIDVNPMSGYDALVTNENGIVPKLDAALPAGTYELREKEPLDGYWGLASYIRFTVSATGAVTLGAHPDGVELIGTLGDGILSYVLTVPNTQFKNVSFKKVDIAQTTTSALAGAEFDLYRFTDGEREETALYSGLTSGADGMLASKDSETIFKLSIGEYQLLETKAPAGYNLKSEPVTVTVAASDVTYEEGTSLSSTDDGVSYAETTKVYTLKITNSAGYELPKSGGAGTRGFAWLGGAMTALGLLGFAWRSRGKRREDA